MRGNQAPVPHTCPLIDRVIRLLEEIYTNDPELASEASEKIEIMELIRSHNDGLRSWGHELLEEKEDLEKRIGRLEDERDDLLDNLKEAHQECRQLQSELRDLEYESRYR